jgi:hypothetical protein
MMNEYAFRKTKAECPTICPAKQGAGYHDGSRIAGAMYLLKHPIMGWSCRAHCHARKPSWEGHQRPEARHVSEERVNLSQCDN